MIFLRLKQLRLKQRGETLIEVIVAMGVLAIGALVASTLIVSTIRSTVVNKNYLVALNLSREGMEAVRAIRATNWMIFPNNTEDCWDVLDDESVAGEGACASSTKFADSVKTYYRVNLNGIADASPYKWVLEPSAVSSKFTVATNSADRKFYLLKPDSANAGLYRHQASNGTQEYDDSNTSFYRAIAIEPAGINNGEVRVVSAIHWFEGGKLKEVNTESILTNFK